MSPKARKIQQNVRTKASISRKILPTVKTSLTGKTLTCQDVRRRNRYGETLLHEAVLKGDTQLLKDILKLRVDVNMVDHTGRTALHEAALRNQYEACFCLINAGALVNIATRMKNTPLHEAITFGNKKIVELLLKHGAHSLSKTMQEQTAFGIREKPQVQAAKTKPKVNLLLDSVAEIPKTNNGKQHRDVGTDIGGDVQLDNGEDVQNGGYCQPNHSKTADPKKQLKKTLPTASQVFMAHADTSLFQGFPVEEDSNSDQTVDYLGESSDESVDSGIKATQEFALSSSIEEDADSNGFPIEMF
ncbi:uncharacterized protein ACBT44_007475 isoform 2-T3 [Syngnathus typhle]